MRDLVRYHFVFLQHGMIMNDLSSWLNHLPIDLMVTTTPHEFAAITASDSPYRFSPRDCVLSGLPRHDALLGQPRRRRWITVAPTWRKWLVSQIDAQSMSRVYKTGFSRSEFARAWGGLLADPQLAQMARESGLEIMFVPHPNLQPVIGDLDLEKHVTLYDPKRHGSYREVIAATALCLTDYSSVTVDMAVLDIPQVYYQFDAELVFNGSHSIGPGYFDYVQDGFGPVARRQEGVLTAITGLLKGQEDPIFAQRRKRTLVHRDGTCCRRLHEAILHRLEIDRERF
jgi:CDP-glycerol glycerophosphotransferase (TagB/SpsB family)